MTLSKSNLTSDGIPEAAAGAVAAGLLADACENGSDASVGSAQLTAVLSLARDLRQDLEVYSSGEAEPDVLAEVAGRCADLASLAACNVAHVPAEGFAKAVSATHLAAGAARALGASIEAAEPSGGYGIRDARGAGWRARLAARQVDELLEARAAEA